MPVKQVWYVCSRYTFSAPEGSREVHRIEEVYDPEITSKAMKKYVEKLNKKAATFDDGYQKWRYYLSFETVRQNVPTRIKEIPRGAESYEDYTRKQALAN